MASLLATAVVVPSASGAATTLSKSPAAVTAPVSALSKSPAAVRITIESKGKPKKAPKAPKQVKFAASGTVTAVDATAGTVTVQVKGGTKDVRRSTVTIAVPATARIVVNGKGKTLADIAVGFGITVTGTNSNGVLTAAR